MYVALTRELSKNSSLTSAGLYKADKSLRRYGAVVERALGSWEVSPQEWADYIAFLGRLLKVRMIEDVSPYKVAF